jgi:hypothetical protein
MAYDEVSENVVKNEAKQRESPDTPTWNSRDSRRGCAEGDGFAVKNSRVRIVSPDILISGVKGSVPEMPRRFRAVARKARGSR